MKPIQESASPKLRASIFIRQRVSESEYSSHCQNKESKRENSDLDLRQNQKVLLFFFGADVVKNFLRMTA
jgi:hypothetical protein